MQYERERERGKKKLGRSLRARKTKLMHDTNCCHPNACEERKREKNNKRIQTIYMHKPCAARVFLAAFAPLFAYPLFNVLFPFETAILLLYCYYCRLAWILPSFNLFYYFLFRSFFFLRWNYVIGIASLRIQHFLSNYSSLGKIITYSLFRMSYFYVSSLE